MSKIVITIIFFVISFIGWLIFLAFNNGFGLPDPPDPLTVLVLLIIPTIISGIYYSISEGTKNNETLSEKYDVLVSYKGLAFLLMFAATGFFIYALVQFGDAPKAARKMLENAMITSTVSYGITMFSLFCLTKIIDFLFDLDKKTNI